MNREMAVAVESFAETLRQMGLKSRRTGLTKPRELGRRAALSVAADVVWRNHLGRLLTRDEAQELLGIGTRQGIHDLVKRGRLLALPTERGTLEFPAFQFDVARREVFPVVKPAIEELRPAFDDDAFAIASWFVSPNDLLGSATPADWMRGRDDDLLLEAARRTAARLER